MDAARNMDGPPGALHILVCTPYRAQTAPALRERWYQHALLLREEHPEHAIDSCLWWHDGRRLRGDGRYSPHARARNSLLDAVGLRLWDYLYWVDVDIITWPEGLLRWALRYNPDGISAPAVTLDPDTDHFYDTLGYIEHGRCARYQPPWFDQRGPVVTLDSVGCCYLIPACVYRDGARYADTPGRTEHESVMAVCRAAGRRIVANLNLRAVHAWPSNYGALA